MIDRLTYAQMIGLAPILGGGLITALSVPLITEFGLPAVTVVSFVLLLATGLSAMRQVCTVP